MTLVSKFLLIFFLAGFLEPKELGLYGLVIATIGYAIYPLGFDFYTYSTRELLERERSEWGGVLKDQGVLHLILYVLVLPLILLVFVYELLPWYLAGWFFVVLVLEHINQELNRLLIAISLQLAASWVLFLRSGAWALCIIVWMYLEPAMRTLEVVLAAWTIGSMLALMLATYRLYKLELSGWWCQINWRWILQGLKIAIPLFLATLAIRAVFTIDRYWFESLQGLDMLAAYVLFMGIGNALLSFMDAGVFSFSYPKLISAYNRGDAATFRQGLMSSLWQSLFLTAAFVAVAFIVIEPLLTMLDRSVYIEQLSLFPWVLMAISLYALSMVPHYALYAQGRDKPIIVSHLAAILVFIPTTWIFSIQEPDKAVLLGLITTFTFLLIYKTWAFYQLTPRQYRSAAAADTH